jgi:hypothetical protein
MVLETKIKVRLCCLWIFQMIAMELLSELVIYEASEVACRRAGKSNQARRTVIPAHPGSFLAHDMRAQSHATTSGRTQPALLKGCHRNSGPTSFSKGYIGHITISGDEDLFPFQCVHVALDVYQRRKQTLDKIKELGIKRTI